MNDQISLKEAGILSGYHPDYISSLIRSGKIKGERVGRNWFTTKAEISRHFSTKHYAPLGDIIVHKPFKWGIYALVLFLFAVVAVYFVYSVSIGSSTYATDATKTASSNGPRVSEDEQAPIIINNQSQ